MEKLTVKELAPYMPYKMKFVIDMYEFTEGNCKPEIRQLTMGNDLSMCLNYGKPILRPLSDLTKEIEHNGEKFVPKNILFKGDKSWVSFKKSMIKNAILCNDYHIISQLFKWHFDVFGLIEKGLAVDMNATEKG